MRFTSYVRTSVLVMVIQGLTGTVANSQRQYKSSAETRRAPSNIILVTIDTVRADHVGCYGANNVETPTLDSLATDGLVFDNAISQVPLTLPSHAVILTGTYPFQNGVQDFTGKPLDKRFVTVAQVLKAHGYATGAVVSAFVLDQSWGLARGFDFYDDAFSPEAYALTSKNMGMVERRAEVSVSHAISWLSKAPRRTFFLWLHLYDPHSPYDPPQPYLSRFQSRPYDGEIAYADHEIGRLLAWLKQRGLYDDSLIVVLSDHGESLGEHGEKEHGFFLYRSTVRVPLIVKPPMGSGIRPGHISRVLETSSVASTLLQAAGINPTPKQFQLPTLLGSDQSKDIAAYSETLYPFNSFGWSPLHAVETGQYHYIDAPEPELYDVVADPQELNNLATKKPAIVSTLKDKLNALLQNNPFTFSQEATSEIASDARDKLRGLGYVAYRSSAPGTAAGGKLADPKDKVAEFQTILSAQDALHQGDVSRGESLLREVAEKDPHMYIVPFYLGESALSREDWRDASLQFNQCLNLNPGFEQCMTGLSRALIRSGNTQEAKVWVDKVLSTNPGSFQAWYARAVIDASTDKVASIAEYERAISIRGNFAPLHRDVGLLQFEQRNYAAAAKHLSKAVDLGVNEAIVFNSLGISYSRTKQLAKAIDSYKQALKLKPELAEAHVNLASVYERLNQKKLAKEQYAAACRLQSRFCDLVP